MKQRTWQQSVRGRLSMPTTLLVILIIMAVSGGGYFLASLTQPGQFADMSHCVTRDDDGLYNNCESDIVVSVCSPGSTCLSMQLEPQQYFVRESAAPSDEIAGAHHACAAPYVPTLSAEGADANTCREPD